MFLATCARGRVAVKKMEINGENVKLLVTEIGIMKTSHHANIVDYFDSFIGKLLTFHNVTIQVDERTLWVVMEFMDGGCLTDILEQFDEIKLTESQIAHCCREVHSKTILQ